jgi:hypothetical protein
MNIFEFLEILFKVKNILSDIYQRIWPLGFGEMGVATFGIVVGGVGK